MERAVYTLESQNRRSNTAKAYESKKEEFIEFCKSVFAEQPPDQITTVEHIKVFQFMWYQAFRCPRKHEKGSPAQRQGFDPTEYLSLKEKYSQSDPAAKIDDPQNGIGISCMAQYKAAILHLWRDQIHRGVNNRSRDEVWQNSSDVLMNMVKSRKHRINKKNYAEKLDEVSAPYALIQQHKEIESSFFAAGCTGINRQVFSSLRNRFCFLMTTFAILRGESMFKAELSDLYGVQVQTPDDPHPIYVMMMQISTGKTNQDLKMFGRAARHKKPLLCPVGALAFYLLYRFSQTGDFESIDDFTKNDRWFDTKLLVDLQQRTNDLNRVISDETYSDAVKKICKQLGIPTQHYVHLGRVLGSVLAEADGDDNELIRILGNWDPKIQEKAYSSKLPMKIVRSRAGFRSNGGVHYSARTIVQPPNELLSQVFPWVDRATQELNAFLQSSPAEARPTAAVFLDFMMKLKVVVLQDAAATMVLHPERSVHQLFQLDVFKSDCFKAYVEQMRQQLAVAEDPSDVTLQAVIPPVVDRLNVLSQQGERNCQATNEVSNQIRTGFDSVHVGHDLILQSIRSLALPINQILQLLQGTEKRSTAIMIGLNAANDYIQRTEHPSHCLPPLNNAVSPQHIINNSNPPSQLPRPNEPSILPQGFGHKLSHSHNSIKDLYNEWYGLDRFKDVPVAGGIQAMDNRYKTAWRRSWSRAAQKKFSRMKIVIDTMNKQIASGRTLLEVSEEFEEAFAKHCKKKISNLVEWLDSNSYRRPKNYFGKQLCPKNLRKLLQSIARRRFPIWLNG